MLKTSIVFILILLSFNGFAQEKKDIIAKSSPVEKWDPGIFMMTSPVGDVFKSLNLQLGYYFSDHVRVSLKGSRFINGYRYNLGNDTGYELGLRTSYLFPVENSDAAFGAHFGVYYTKFSRYYTSFQQSVDNILNSAFNLPADNFEDENDVKGAMFELLVGPTVHIGRGFILEGLGGLQLYRSSYYRYNPYSKVKTVNGSASWKVYPTVEFNVGLTF